MTTLFEEMLKSLEEKTGLHLNPYTISKSHKLAVSKAKNKDKATISENAKRTWANPETRAKRTKAIRLAMAKPEYHEKLSRIQTEIFKDPKEREKRVVAWQNLSAEEKSRKTASVRSASGSKPTMPEQKVQALLDCYCPRKFMYTGNGKIVMIGLIPDFIDCDGSKKVIEVFGDYWHGYEKVGRTKEEEENHRIKSFAKFGFECLIIWEHELAENQLDKTIEKIVTFDQTKHNHAHILSLRSGE